MRAFGGLLLLLPYHVAVAQQCTLDEAMIKEIRMDLESEADYMQFFEKFDSMTPQERSSCKEVLLDSDDDDVRARRKMQTLADDVPYPSAHNGTAADFLAPCYPLPADPQADGWTRIGNANPFDGDDGMSRIELGFDFSLYGTTWTSVEASVNGFLSFGRSLPFFFASREFPVGFNIVSPFWADVDVRNAGQVWYKDFGTHLAVVWDRAGRFLDAAGTGSNRRNTFQVVISDGGAALGENNVCFCYVDMDWWSGAALSSRPANVGINNGATREYVQIGRFRGDGTAYDGPGGERDGVDWLDYQGSSLQDPAIQGLCFDVQETTNVPPVVSGFPEMDSINLACQTGVLDLSLTFATPEMDQAITLTLPPNLGSIPGLTVAVTESSGGESVGVKLDWTPDFATQSGTVALTFVATDNFAGGSASVTRTLTINVAECAVLGPDPPDQPELPEQCLSIIGSACSAGDPQPFCTPYRSPESCPFDESFSNYLRSRNEIIQSAPASLEGLSYWFHFLQDKVASYAFTTDAGYSAPGLLCCTDSVTTFMDDCFPSGGVNPTSFVIRVVGEQHSSMAVYVLPSGFGGPELTRPLPSMTANQVMANIENLALPPSKIIVEEFISGGPPGSAPTLPNEYKVHAFDGTISSIGMVLNRGSDCSCYAEVDTDWTTRLDKYGCFTPSVPFGMEFPGSGSTSEICYNIDFEAGAKRPFPMKGQDLCGMVPQLEPACLAQDLIATAQAISQLIGVYVRIDFFIGGDNKIYIQEYTFNHNNGLRHCSAKQRESDGCIDSCFIGRQWKNSAPLAGDARVLGGPATPLPAIFNSWSSLSPAGQCSVGQNAVAGTPAASATC